MRITCSGHPGLLTRFPHTRPFSIFNFPLFALDSCHLCSLRVGTKSQGVSQKASQMGLFLHQHSSNQRESVYPQEVLPGGSHINTSSLGIVGVCQRQRGNQEGL